MTPAELLRRARERCDEHRGPTHGICRECLLAEMEEMLLEQNPGMCRTPSSWLRSGRDRRGDQISRMAGLVLPEQE